MIRVLQNVVAFCQHVSLKLSGVGTGGPHLIKRLVRADTCGAWGPLVFFSLDIIGCFTSAPLWNWRTLSLFFYTPYLRRASTCVGSTLSILGGCSFTSNLSAPLAFCSSLYYSGIDHNKLLKISIYFLIYFTS